MCIHTDVRLHRVESIQGCIGLRLMVLVAQFLEEFCQNGSPPCGPSKKDLDMEGMNILVPLWVPFVCKAAPEI